MKKREIIDGTLLCSKCFVRKPLDDFQKNGHYKDGDVKYKSHCKKCRRGENHTEAAKDRKDRWLRNNPKKRRQAVNEWNTKIRFGLSWEEYQTKIQNSVCGICGEDGRLHKLHLDHNHVNGKVRGVLCQRCNQALGLLDDDISKFEKAIAWLRDDGLV